MAPWGRCTSGWTRTRSMSTPGVLTSGVHSRDASDDDEFRGLGHWAGVLYAVTKNKQGTLSVWKLNNMAKEEWSEYARPDTRELVRVPHATWRGAAHGGVPLQWLPSCARACATRHRTGAKEDDVLALVHSIALKASHHVLFEGALPPGFFFKDELNFCLGDPSLSASICL